ncbi:MAG: SPFH domain-containing protein [Chloroflexi bacterium]|nr:SPFH domain-containing protein [Chloroflexota bacterium]
MFDPKKVIAFYLKIIGSAVVLLGLLLSFSTLAELRAHFDDAPTVLIFWLFVFLNIIPSLIAVWIVFHLPARFVQALYGLKDIAEGRTFIVSCHFGRPQVGPFVVVGKGTIEGGSDALKRIGGPGGVLVFDDAAAILERSGKITRVEGPGFSELEPFEKVWDTIDLRHQRWEYKVNAMTLEGIPVICMADVRFKIDDNGQKPTEESPHPMTREAVLKAAFCKWIREPDRSEPDRLMDWTKRVIVSHTEGALRTILACYNLDQLIEPRFRQEIRDKLSASLKKSVPGLGAKIIKVELGNITIQDEVTQQWIKKWQAEKRRKAETLIAEGKALGTLLEAEAQAQVKLDMLRRSADILEDLKAKYGEDIPPRLIALRFADMIRNLSNTMPFLPNDVVATLGVLEKRLEPTDH